MTRYAIGVGSNVGERLAHLRFGAEELRSLGSLADVSPLYETAPVGGPDQPPFLNAVVLIESGLGAAELLGRLQEIEAKAGRVREERWGPRTLDLDILATDAAPVAEPDLEIPHPRAAERLFVLEPLSEVWPDADVGGLTAAQAKARCDSQEVDRLRSSWTDEADRWVGALLVAIQFLWFAAIAVVIVVEGELPSGIDTPTAAGVALGALGLVLGLESGRRLGPALRAHPEPSGDGVFVEDGPYSLARHPIYGGIVLFMMGASLALHSVWALVLSLGLTGFFLVKTEYEERRLRARYAGYRAYRRRVRHRLIPFVL